ncbi:MAG: DUF805 domain-containing protein, partial [Treponema sp.]|nr:DUF805 domain-containing protein [Treponema sp.]
MIETDVKKKLKTQSNESFFYFIGQCFKKYFDFKGRARRKEYWYFTLFSLIYYIIIYYSLMITFLPLLVLFDFNLSPFLNFFINLVFGIFYISLIIPSFAVIIRRLHDTGRSWVYILYSLIPFVGIVILIVFCANDSEPSDNKYGPNPKVKTFGEDKKNETISKISTTPSVSETNTPAKQNQNVKKASTSSTKDPFFVILQRMKSERGFSIFEDYTKCNSLLKDYSAGEYKKECRLLLLAI